MLQKNETTSLRNHSIADHSSALTLTVVIPLTTAAFAELAAVSVRASCGLPAERIPRESAHELEKAMKFDRHLVDGVGIESPLFSDTADFWDLRSRAVSLPIRCQRVVWRDSSDVPRPRFEVRWARLGRSMGWLHGLSVAGSAGRPLAAPRNKGWATWKKETASPPA